MKKRIAILTLAVALAAVFSAGCGKLKESDAAMTIDGVKVPAGVANFFARYVQAQYETNYASYMGEDMWAGEAEKGRNYEETVKKDIQETLENMYLLEAHMKAYGVKLEEKDKEAVKRAALAFDKSNGLEEKEKISASKAVVERALTLFAVQEKMRLAIEDTANTEVSDEEAAQKKMKYIVFPFTSAQEDGSAKELTKEERKELKKTAKAFEEGVKASGDFEARAKEQGLEISEATFDAKTDTLPLKLVKEADKLKEGEATGLIEEEDGYYVAKVESLFDREATDAKKQSIAAERRQEKFDSVVKKWRKKADIKVNKRVWRKINFQKLSVTMKSEDKEPYADAPKTDDQAGEAAE